MNKIAPPKMMQSMLLALLPANRQETVSGDLHEAYAERRMQMGAFSANAWYALQVFSFVPRACIDAYAHNPLLALVCCFTAASGAWLGMMTILLGHYQHMVRSESIAGTIVAQALLTLAALPLRRVKLLRWLALAGCLPVLYLAIGALYSTLHSTDTEGYILLISMALIVQAILTWIALIRTPKAKTTVTA